MKIYLMATDEEMKRISLERQFIFSTIISDYEADSSGGYVDSRECLVQPGHADLSKNIMQRDVARLHLMF